MSVRTRSSRIEVRATAEDRALIDHAVEVEGSDLTDFVVRHSTEAARRVLADRGRFVLNADAAAEWERINAEPARDLPSLRRLMVRPSPFKE